MSIKKLAGETAIYGMSSILGRVLNFALMPLYTQIFQREAYGNVVFIYATIAFLMVFFTYRMEMAYFRFGTEKNIERKTTFNTAITSLIVSTIILAVIAGIGVPYYAVFSGLENFQVYLYLGLGIICLDTLCELPYAELRLEGRPLRFAAIRLTSIAVNLGLNLFFLLFCPWALTEPSLLGIHPLLQQVYSPDIGIGYIFIANLVASLVTFLLLVPSFKHYQFLFDRLLWKRMLSYILPLVIVGLAYLINENLDKLLLPGLLSGTMEENKAALGEYGACYKLAILIALFTQAFRYGAEPFFFRNKNEHNARQLYAQVAKYFLIVGLIGFLVVVLYIDIFKLLIRNEAYWNGLKIVPIVLLANVLAGLYYNFSVWYKLIDQTQWGAYISVGGAMITILLNIWWIPLIGYMGSAWATLICYTAMTFACYFFGRKYYPVPYPIEKMIFYLLLAVGLYGLSNWLGRFHNGGLIFDLSVNTLILMTFIGIVFLLERKSLKVVLQRKR